MPLREPTPPAAHRPRASRARTRARAALVSTIAATALLAPASLALARVASNGLPYSTASARAIQRQPSAGSCHAEGAGLYSRPDPRCTPGALNPAVTQSTIATTICRSGWTSTVRPLESITEPEKFASMRSYGDGYVASRFEYDHLVPLELGGATNDPRNLWPEPDYAHPAGYYLNPKDRLERALNWLVCDGAMSLAHAQALIAANWLAAYDTYG